MNIDFRPTNNDPLKIPKAPTAENIGLTSDPNIEGWTQSTANRVERFKRVLVNCGGYSDIIILAFSSAFTALRGHKSGSFNSIKNSKRKKLSGVIKDRNRDFRLSKSFLGSLWE